MGNLDDENLSLRWRENWTSQKDKLAEMQDMLL